MAACRKRRLRLRRFHRYGHLAHLGHLRRRHRRAAVAPARLDERHHLGSLLVIEDVRIRRHRQRRRRRARGRHGAARQHDVDGRRGVVRLQHGIAGQRRESLVVALAVGTVTAGATVQVQLRALGVDDAAEQLLAQLVIGDKCWCGRIRWRQRFQVFCHRRQVAIRHVLHGMGHHVVHGAERRRMAVAARFEEFGDLRRAPARQSAAMFIAQRWHGPAVDHAAAGQEGRVALVRQRFFLHAHAARRMAGAAVAQALHQVGAAQQLRIARDRRFIRLRRGGKGPAPDGQGETHRQRPRNVGSLVRRRIRLHAMHEIGVQRLHVRLAQARVRRVRHGRIHGVAVLGHAGAHQLVEIGKAPVADAGLFIGRDIGGIHLADRRFHAQAAGERLAFRAGRMAGDAVAGAGQVFALAYQLGVRDGGGGRPSGAGSERQQQRAHCLGECVVHLLVLHQATRGRGSFRYCSRMALADQ
ncbi:hypothetical protein VM94_01928 [Janthinobacterium sp. KBS0711]|nr:hypothetical protein VM94_01928 [Janthinobacterium sp. KBS0711]